MNYDLLQFNIHPILKISVHIYLQLSVFIKSIEKAKEKMIAVCETTSSILPKNIHDTRQS